MGLGTLGEVPAGEALHPPDGPLCPRDNADVKGAQEGVQQVPQMAGAPLPLLLHPTVYQGKGQLGRGRTEPVGGESRGLGDQGSDGG